MSSPSHCLCGGFRIAKVIQELLMNQKRIISLNIDSDISGYDCPEDRCHFSLKRNRVINQTKCVEEEREKIENALIEAIAKHQSTLECLELSNCSDVTLNGLAKNQSRIEFPKLRAIGYPGISEYDSLAMAHFLYQILRHRNVEEINTYYTDTIVGPGWSNELSDAVISAIKEGFTSNLKKVTIDCIVYCEPSGLGRFLCERAVDALIQNCPRIVQLRCSFDFRFPKELFSKLLTHYNKSLVYLSCGIDDELAEMIVTYCENLTALSVIPARQSSLSELSDRGFITLSKLRKLKIFCYIKCFYGVNVNGVVEFLSYSVTNLRELTLSLPCDFFNNHHVYDIISKGDMSIQRLSLDIACYCGHYNSHLYHRILKKTQAIQF